jgi:hypothetical protein
VRTMSVPRWYGVEALVRGIGPTLLTATVAMLVFAGCTSDGREPGTPTQAASTSNTGSSTTTGASTTELPRVSLKLGPPPSDCNGPTPREIASFVGPAVGESPLWAVGPVGPHATLGLGRRKKWGWGQKVLLLIEPGHEGTVTVRGTSVDDGTPIWFKSSGRYVLGPTTKLVLDPQNPAIPIQHGQWKEWPSTFYIPRAGCYFLEARWSGGSWRLTFAAGKMQP